MYRLVGLAAKKMSTFRCWFSIVAMITHIVGSSMLEASPIGEPPSAGAVPVAADARYVPTEPADVYPRLSGEARPIGIVEPVSRSNSIVRVASSLAIVLGLLFVAVWLIRHFGGAVAEGGKSRELFSLLGRERVSGKNHVCVVRFGERLLLLGEGPTGLRTLAQVTEPEECDRILAYYRQPRFETKPSVEQRRPLTPGRRNASHYTPTEDELRAWMRREQASVS